MKVSEQISFLKRLSRTESANGEKELSSNLWECAITLEATDARVKALEKNISELVDTDDGK